MSNLMTGQRENSVASGSMRTSFTLTSDGKLNAVTKTWTKVKMKGFTGSVVIVFLKANKEPAWASSMHRYGVNGCWLGNCDRTENWSDSIPLDRLSEIKGYSILQSHSPKWLELLGQRCEQFLKWLNSEQGQSTLETIGKLAVMAV